MPFDLRTRLASPTGATLRLYCRRASGTAHGVVQISHGLAEHAARYARFADFLSLRGFHTFAHDHRGHGDTVAADAPRGSFGGPDGIGLVLADMAAVNAAIAGDHPGLPVIVFGHSLGGLIAINFLVRHPGAAHAAAIWNVGLQPSLAGQLARAMLAYERFRLGSDVPSLLMPKLTFGTWAARVPDRATPFDWLSRDAAEVARYVADPCCGRHPTVAMWRDVLSLALSTPHRLRAIPRDLPFNLVGGAADPVTEGGRAVEALARRMMRSRKLMEGKIKALSAEAKASAYIIGSLPFLVMGAVKVASPQYLDPLFNERMGNFILIGAGIWMLMGIFVMKKMTQIKV